MRRRSHPPHRPALPRRAIVWFPSGPTVGPVEPFRLQHDPLAATIPAHVTLVFPFASSLSALQVATHARRVLARWPRFAVTLDGVDAIAGQWICLRVTRGATALTEMHDRLYHGPLAPFLRPELAYEPHLTVGRADDAASCRQCAAAARSALSRPIDAVVDALTICRLHPKGSVIREGDIFLD